MKTSIIAAIALLMAAPAAMAADPAVRAATAARRAGVKAVRPYDRDRSRSLDAAELADLNEAYAAAPDGPLAIVDRNRDGTIGTPEIEALKLGQRPAGKEQRAAARGARVAAPPPPAIPAEDIGTGTARLSWQAPTHNADGTPLKNLSGYVIRYGRKREALNRRIAVNDPRRTEYVVEGLGEGLWYFSVSAVSAAGAESSPGPVVSKKIASGATQK